MKKFFSLLCIGLMSVAFVGCDEGGVVEPTIDGVEATVADGGEETAEVAEATEETAP
jgi:hypothetical protein